MTTISSRFQVILVQGVVILSCLYSLVVEPQTASAQIMVGPNINVSQRAENQAEVAIAINPANPMNLIAGSNSQEAKTQDLVWWSNDGGLTWTEVGIPNPVGSVPGGDPSIVFDRQGQAYYSHLIDCGFSGCDVASAVSADGGQNWTAARITTDTKNDKNFFGAGPDANDLSRDRIYLGYQKNGVQYVQSTIDGINWSGEARVSDAGNDGINIQFAVDDAGNVYAAWQGIRPLPASGVSDIFFDSSSNGGATWGTDTIAYTSNVAPFRDPFNFSTCGRQYCVPAAPDRGIGAYLSMEADRSGGSFNGRIYMSVVDQADLDGDPDANDPTAHDDTDVFVLYSDDQGHTWSGPVRVNDDATQNSQALPWLDVDQTTGVVAVGWYDARNDDGGGGAGDTNNTANDDVQFFATASRDGGVTYLPNEQVSMGASNQGGAEPYPSGYANFDYGEYPGIAILDTIIHAVWADNSNSTGDNPDGALRKQDIYTAKLDVNLPPVCDANGPYTAECGLDIALDGSGSYDPDGDILTFEWTGPFTPSPASGEKPTVVFPSPTGDKTITLDIADVLNDPQQCDAQVTVQDTLPPNIAAVAATPNELWPPNGKFRSVNLMIGVADVCDSTPDCRIIEVSSNEPVDGLGDGNTAPDWEVTGDLSVKLRAERSGTGTGRIYTVTVGCIDAAGNEASAAAVVTVPHDQ